MQRTEPRAALSGVETTDGFEKRVAGGEDNPSEERRKPVWRGGKSLSLHIYIYIYTCIYVNIYIYTYICI